MPHPKARRLRRASTDAERRVWSALRHRRLSRYKFRRQHPIGPDIVDLACTQYRLVIEIDGGQHADSKTDARRTTWLQGGWQVIRFWNNELLGNTAGVIESILQALQAG